MAEPAKRANFGASLLEEGELSRLVLVALVAALAACASTPPKQVATAPAPKQVATPQSPAASTCPVFIIDGVVQPSTCALPAKTDSTKTKAKCDRTAPVYVVDGVVTGCTKPEGR